MLNPHFLFLIADKRLSNTKMIVIMICESDFLTMMEDKYAIRKYWSGRH